MNPSCPAATLTFAAAAAETWPVVVIGAGVAGCAAAREWARRGVRTLLVDRGRFPRGKVCGGCLNGSAVASLAAMDLGGLPPSIGARPLSRVEMFHRGKRAILATPHGWAVSREAFDAALVQAAIDAGAEFLCGAAARIVSLGDAEFAAEVELRGDDRRGVGGRTRGGSSLAEGEQGGDAASEDAAAEDTAAQDADGTAAPLGEAQPQAELGEARLHAEVVVCADGLSGQSLRGLAPFAVEVHPRARIGAGAVFERRAGEAPLPAGAIQMACGGSGYVGLVAVEGERIDVAAAFDPGFLRAAGTPAAAALRILAEAGLPAPEGLAEADWSGVAALTRSRKPFAAGRVFLVGDSAGYVEPFTGEGMAWALEGARRLVGRLAPAFEGAAALQKKDGVAAAAAEWDREWAAALRSRRRTCRWVTAALRSSWAWSGLFAALRQAPWLAAPVVRWLNAPPRSPARGSIRRGGPPEGAPRAFRPSPPDGRGLP